MAGDPDRVCATRDPNRSVTTIASWYGTKFHGKKMANGNIFNMHNLTAAHRRLPLGTRLLVTNPDSGLSVVVTITDRGPYILRRTLDLSYAAANKIKMIKQGVIAVKVLLLKEEHNGQEVNHAKNWHRKNTKG